MACVGYFQFIVIILMFINISINYVSVDAARKGSRNSASKKQRAKQDTEGEIRARIKQFVKNWNENDMHAVSMISAKNGRLMGQGIPTLDGRRDILNGLLEAKKSLDQIHISVNDLFPINKKFAYHSETWKAFDKEGRMLLGNGRSLVVWKKIGNVWYIMRHMFNDSGLLHRK